MLFCPFLLQWPLDQIWFFCGFLTQRKGRWLIGHARSKGPTTRSFTFLGNTILKATFQEKPIPVFCLVHVQGVGGGNSLYIVMLRPLRHNWVLVLPGMFLFFYLQWNRQTLWRRFPCTNRSSVSDVGSRVTKTNSIRPIFQAGKWLSEDLLYWFEAPAKRLQRLSQNPECHKRRFIYNLKDATVADGRYLKVKTLVTLPLPPHVQGLAP